MSAELEAEDFFTGLFAALRLQGWRSISIRGDRFDAAIAQAFHSFRDAADREEVELDFRIRPHPIHGDSETVRDGIASAAQRGLISLDNPEYQDIRFRFTEDEAGSLVSSLPMPREAFVQLAEAVIRHYEMQTA